MVSVDVKHHVYWLLCAACISVCCFYCLSTQTIGKSFRGRWLCDTYGEYFGRLIIIIIIIIKRISRAPIYSTRWALYNNTNNTHTRTHARTHARTNAHTHTHTHTHTRTHVHTPTRASDEGIRTAVKNSLEIITWCERCAETRSASSVA